MDNPMRYKFLKEVENRNRRYFKIVKDYRPVITRNYITEKFYSKYESRSFEPHNLDKKTLNKYVILMDAKLEETPQTVSPLPVTENQIYGWLWTKRFNYDELDCELFCRNRHQDEVFKIMGKMYSKSKS